MEINLVLGVIMLCLGSFIFGSYMAFWKSMQESEWPVHFTNGLGVSIAIIAIASFALVRRISLPVVGVTWVVLRSVFSTIQGLCQILAVQEGVSIGDASALTSISLVFAAILGRIFLGEKLKFMDMLAIGCSLCGAMFIARPSFIFGNDAAASPGHLLALLAGFLSALTCICARKSAKASPVWSSLGLLIIFAVLSFCLPYISLAPRVPLAKVAEHPWISTYWVVATTVTFVACSLLYSGATQICPAAVSSITDASASMVCGYVIEMIVLGRSPKGLSLVGAFLMISGTAIMTARRRPNVEKEPQEDIGESESVTSSVGSTLSSIKSIASFAAVEFAEQSPKLRRIVRKGVQASPDQIAICMTSVVPSVLGSACSSLC